MGYESYLQKVISEGRSLYTEQLEQAISELTKEFKRRKEAEREKLRIELMKNLQKAIGDILHNGFCLTIQNTDVPDSYANFAPDEIYHIEIEQRQCRYFLKHYVN